MKRILTADPAGRKRSYVTDTPDGFVIHAEQDTRDIEAFTKWASGLQSDWGPTRWHGDCHHVATVPQVLVERHLMSRDPAGKWRFKPEREIRRWLDDRDNQLWRTKPGKLSR